MNRPFQTPAQASSLLSIRSDNGLLFITMTAPPANMLSLELIEALIATLKQARSDEAVRVILIGAQGRIYSAGHDLKELKAHREDADGGRAFLEHLFRRCSDLMKLVVRVPKPVIAVVGGVATAAGCQLVASCDLAVASERAGFCTPGVNIGGFCSTPMVALSRNIARKHAMEMLLTGENIDAMTALRFGLVNQVVKPDELEQTAIELAMRIAEKSPTAMLIGKSGFYAQAEMRLAEAYDFANEIMVEGFLSPDADEGVQAFIDKRKPNWKRD